LLELIYVHVRIKGRVEGPHMRHFPSQALLPARHHATWEHATADGVVNATASLLQQPQIYHSIFYLSPKVLSLV